MNDQDFKQLLENLSLLDGDQHEDVLTKLITIFQNPELTNMNGLAIVENLRAARGILNNRDSN